MNFRSSVLSGCWGEIPLQEVTIHRLSSRAAGWAGPLGRREADTYRPRLEAHTMAKSGRPPAGGAEHRQLGHLPAGLDFNTSLGLHTEQDAARFPAMEPRRPPLRAGESPGRAKCPKGKGASYGRDASSCPGKSPSLCLETRRGLGDAHRGALPELLPGGALNTMKPGRAGGAQP